jgi:hypothetical protein
MELLIWSAFLLAILVTVLGFIGFGGASAKASMPPTAGVSPTAGTPPSTQRAA